MEEDKGLHDDDKRPGFVSNHVTDRPGSCLDSFSASVDSLQAMCSQERAIQSGSLQLGTEQHLLSDMSAHEKRSWQMPTILISKCKKTILVTVPDKKVQW